MTFLPEVENTGQLLTFLLASAAGAVFCLFYDFFRVWRKISPPSAVLAFFQDILFWVLCAFAFFCFLIVRCDGQIRIYALLGALLGFFAFRKTLSRIIFPVILFCVKTVFNLFNTIVCKLICPVINSIKRIIRCLLKYINRLFSLCINYIKKLFFTAVHRKKKKPSQAKPKNEGLL